MRSGDEKVSDQISGKRERMSPTKIESLSNQLSENIMVQTATAGKEEKKCWSQGKESRNLGKNGLE